jgi:hypothetical protein
VSWLAARAAITITITVFMFSPLFLLYQVYVRLHALAQYFIYSTTSSLPTHLPSWCTEPP